MPRLLRKVFPLRTVRKSHIGAVAALSPDKVFGASWTDFVAFMAKKYAIPKDSMRTLLFDAFRYVRQEVLFSKTGKTMTIPNFGTFRRYVVEHARVTPTGGVSSARVRLKFREWKGTSGVGE